MKKVLVCVSVLAVGFLAGYFLHSHKDQIAGSEFREGGYTFINPLLECEIGSIISEKKFINFKKDIEGLIQNEKAKNSISTVALYYRDLNNGPWFGINEKEKFIPASLLKLPLAVAVFSASQEQPELLSSNFEYLKSDFFNEQYFKPKEEIKEGSVYSTEELVRRALTYSDNNAALLLAQIIGNKKLGEVYSDLLVTPPVDGNYQISVKDYGSFFRVLFNASYLNKENSEKVLSILSGSEFKMGIVRNLPVDVKVSHKFGEASLPSGEKQLHDCGIIYKTNYPYLLCIMTRGSDFDKMGETIGQISKIIYDKVGKE